MTDLPGALVTATFHVTSANGGEFTFRADFAALFRQLEEAVPQAIKDLKGTPPTAYAWVQPPDYVRDSRAVRDPTAIGWLVPETELLLGSTGLLYRISGEEKVLRQERQVNLQTDELHRLLAGLRSMTTKS
jgi:hypothetical protein